MGRWSNNISFTFAFFSGDFETDLVRKRKTLATVFGFISFRTRFVLKSSKKNVNIKLMFLDCLTKIQVYCMHDSSHTTKWSTTLLQIKYRKILLFLQIKTNWGNFLFLLHTQHYAWNNGEIWGGDPTTLVLHSSFFSKILRRT